MRWVAPEKFFEDNTLYKAWGAALIDAEQQVQVKDYDQVLATHGNSDSDEGDEVRQMADFIDYQYDDHSDVHQQHVTNVNYTILLQTVKFEPETILKQQDHGRVTVKEPTVKFEEEPAKKPVEKGKFERLMKQHINKKTDYQSKLPVV